MFSNSEEKLANQVMKSILAFDPNCQPEYVKDQSLIFIPESDSENRSAATINLSSLFSEWKKLPRSEQTQQIDEVVEATLNIPSESADQRLANLRLRARTQEELSYRNQNPATASDFANTQYGNGSLVLELVENAETLVKIVTSDILDELSISADDAYAMAAAAHRRETDANQWQEIGDVWMSNYQDDFDFARLVITGGDTHFPFNGDTVIAYAPSHSVCLITNNQDAHALEQLVSIGDQLSSDQRTLSKYLWTLDDSGEWNQYEIAINAEAARVIKTQEIRENTLTYSDQQGLLERENFKDDIHVASYVGFEIESGEIFSNTTYTLNQTTSLPRTDIVSIYDDEAEAIIGMLNWDEFTSILGTSVQIESSLKPPRYTLNNNIDATKLDTIRSELLAKAA